MVLARVSLVPSWSGLRVASSRVLSAAFADDPSDVLALLLWVEFSRVSSAVLAAVF
jgi:hypothetical protein